MVSIGNLTVGGSGKTPFLIALGELLKERGVAFDVLSRGYGRATKGVALVDPEGSPRDFGDEPLLIARKLRVPVIVGEDRYAAGQFAEQKFGAQLHLLDDGFQHRRLARDFDIVLITPSDAQDTLLPTGRLREPLSSLSRADAVVLTNDASCQGLPIAKQHVWKVRRGIVAASDSTRPVLLSAESRVPRTSSEQLRAAGVTLAGTRSFRDHHAYSDATCASCWRCGAARGIVVRHHRKGRDQPWIPRRGSRAPACHSRSDTELDDADAALSTLLAAIARAKSRPCMRQSKIDLRPVAAIHAPGVI